MVERVIGNDEVTGPIPVPSLEGPFEEGSFFFAYMKLVQWQNGRNISGGTPIGR